MSPALRPLSNLAFLLLQLVAYWEKTFKIDLFKPQIGVVNVTDVSILTEAWSGGLSHPVGCYTTPTIRSFRSLQPQVELLGLSQTLGDCWYSPSLGSGQSQSSREVYILAYGASST